MPDFNRLAEAVEAGRLPRHDVTAIGRKVGIKDADSASRSQVAAGLREYNQYFAEKLSQLDNLATTN